VKKKIIMDKLKTLSCHWIYDFTRYYK